MYSSLTSNVILTDKCNGRNGNPVCKITPHHMAGVMSGADCATYLANTARECSANYCIGVNGDIACNVEEENRAWTSSSWDNDKNAITIEVSDSDDQWNISDASWQALVNLCVDICKRYGFSLNYTGDANGSLTEHRMFANTECPGEPLHNRMAELAQTVNAQLNGQPVPTTTPSAPVSNGFAVGDTVVPTNLVDYNGNSLTSYHDSYTISELNGDRAVLSVGGTIWAAMNTSNLAHVGDAPAQDTSDTVSDCNFAVGDTVHPTSLVDYDGNSLASYHDAYTITELVGDRAVLSVDGTVWAAMNTANISKIGGAPAPSVSYDQSISVGNRVIPCSDYDYDGTYVTKFQDTYTVSEINGDRAVLVNDNGDVWCAMHVSDLKRD